GYFFNFACSDASCKKTINEKTKIAINYLKKGQKDAFSNMLLDICHFIFQIMKESLSSFGLEDAEAMRLP
ncbi:MAG: hypothetical protein ACOYJB_10675, partial [Christensenellaceae bacterium]